jgi:Notch-like protein
MRLLRFPRRLEGRTAFPLLLALSALLSVPGHALAVVEQTDGLVVPVQVANCPGSGVAAGCIQVGLNLGEGLAATAQNNPLHAVFDATTSPEIFSVPLLNGVYGNVKIDDLIEGAGYENTFGWYNVSDPSILYAITPCADEPGSSRTVNFQTELVQGRYLGGFIGFFLVTPEDAPVANNCGAINNVGHLYYTEQAKNGDGNYVHYLLYKSEVNPLAYYFGFEDLYRGGDNDFEDMFLKVTGLLAPCTPSAEICDGLDNNCDGLVDNSPVDAGSECGPMAIGECSPGTEECVGGTLTCVGGTGPSPELCNGKDDDCDGMIDDNPVDVGAECGTDAGECSFGGTQCIGGVLVCVGGAGPSLEVCNLLDDDCDGTADETPIDAGGPCGSNVGACTPGVLVCADGMIECSGGTGGTPEICNGIDDDCNGAIDDGDPGGGGLCGSDEGVCDPGIEHCIGGMIVCVGGTGPSDEICDGLDNDCDGTADELAPCPGTSQCVAGSCGEPCQPGEFPCPGGQTCVDGYCVPDTCEGVSCDPGFSCMQGVCIEDGGGGAGGGSGGGASTGGGSSTSTGGSGATNSGGAGGSGEPSNWRLATGGGGLSCAAAPGSARDLGAAAALALVGLAALARRRRNGRVA